MTPANSTTMDSKEGERIHKEILSELLDGKNNEFEKGNNIFKGKCMFQDCKVDAKYFSLSRTGKTISYRYCARHYREFVKKSNMLKNRSWIRYPRK